MSYQLFYNYKALNDVLIISINPILDATNYVKRDNVVAIYNEQDIIGYNIFGISKLIKIHYQGMIVSIIQPLIDVINDILKNHQFPILQNDENHPFVVGEIVDCKNNIYIIDIGNKKIDIYCAENLMVNDCVVVCKPNIILPNGSINIKYSIASKAMLMVDDEDNIFTFHQNNKIGSDFYLGEVKWSN